MYCETVPSFTYDNYIYIRGAPDSSIWNCDGTTTDVASIVPRNRNYGDNVSTDDGFVTEKTHLIKASLNSMRLMNLVLTDKDGVPCKFDEDFIIKLAVRFE